MSSENEVGRPEHEPTQQTRNSVSQMASYGIIQDIIAKCIGISLPTLHKHYRHELDTAAANLTVLVANKLISNALDENNISAQIFYLKTKGGWKEQKDDDDKPKSEAEQFALRKV